MKINIKCALCGGASLIEAGAVNRAKRRGANLYCSRACAGLARRNGKTIEQKRADKSEYDKVYRATNIEAITARKRAYHLATYDPKKAAVVRRARMPRHIQYCRAPEYRAKKKIYDQRRLATQKYGDFADAAIVLLNLEGEILDRMSRLEIMTANGTLNKKLQRSRIYG